MSNVGSVRIWAAWTAADPEAEPPVAQDYDYVDLAFAAALPNLAQLAVEQLDRRGLAHRIVPPSPDNRAYVTRLAVVFPSRKLDLLNNSDAPARRHLAAWLEHYHELDSEFVIYTTHTAYPRGVASVTTLRQYRGRLWGLPPEALSLLNNLGGSLPPYLTLDFNVTDQGTPASWDSVDLTTGWDGR